MTPNWRDPYLIMVAPNGARRTKDDHPALPITQDEIVDAVASAHDAGAQAVHVHVRDETGVHVLDAARYLRLTDALRARCGEDLIVQITTEAVGRYTPNQQRALVEAVKPQAVSIAFKELFANRQEDAINSAFLSALIEAHIAVQWILYHPSEMDDLAAMIDSGTVPQVSPLLFVLGRYTQGQQSQPADIMPFLLCREKHPAIQNASWSVCAFGAAETACLTAALLLGGDARIGFENSLWDADGALAASNAHRVGSLTAVAKRLALTPADARTARKRLAIAHD